MVKVQIDISVFTKDAAIGMVSGPLELAIVPQVGDRISFQVDGSLEAFVGEKKFPFGGQLGVTDRVVAASDGTVLLMLEDVTAATSEDARRLMEMLAQHHGLFLDIWE